jgi:peptidoglycan hydrolase FlgJ
MTLSSNAVTLPLISSPLAPSSAPPKDIDAAALEFEAAFLAEMLTHAGFGEAFAQNSGFGGESMASFFIAEMSRELASKDSFGVAALIEKELGASK